MAIVRLAASRGDGIVWSRSDHRPVEHTDARQIDGVRVAARGSGSEMSARFGNDGEQRSTSNWRTCGCTEGGFRWLIAVVMVVVVVSVCFSLYLPP